MGITNMIQSISIPLAKATLSPGLLLLHATHLFLLILTLLFLVLPAISGPGTNIWWMTITLPTPSSTTGSVWNLGGLGACKVGDICDATTAAGENVPVMAGQVKSTLMYHLAVAGISTLMALVEYGPGPGPSAICAGWTATYLLVAVPVLVSTPMIVDLVVRSKILKDENIDSVVIGGVFWLSPVALAMSIFWSLAIFRTRLIRYRETGRDIAEKEEKSESRSRAKAQAAEESAGGRARPGGLRGLWPW